MSDTVSVFLGECRERLVKGEATYGPVRADNRNRCAEALDEARDAYNYIVPIMLVKHPTIKNTPEWQGTVSCIYRLYKALKKLEVVEKVLESTQEKGG